ncbi:response regulator [Siphonobacter curvatus]|uniref:Response regulator n=1 Tax=Siphonobacter curvatus TaxID=2094562 RepID=A0A2S7IPZ2_9BACT|nr:response regulator [Siphonobacter curvatus]PQA59752.1 response regulator [Siphonobacter curvatus]
MNKDTTPRNFRKAKLLVVEDNPDHWFLIESVLKQQLPEVEVIWMPDASQTMTYLNDCKSKLHVLPKVILLDLYLPSSQEGLRLLQTIKSKNSSFYHIPTIVLSHSSDATDISRCYETGGSSYIIKPTLIQQWVDYFKEFRRYWWNIVSLPDPQYQ